MRIELSMRPRLEQRLVLAPQIIQSIEILQLPLLALRERIEQEQLENPLLEVADEERLGGTQTKIEQTQERRDERATKGEDFAKIDNMSEAFREYFTQTAPARPAPSGRDDKMEALQNTAAPGGSLQDFLLEQLQLLELKPSVREAAENIIFNLNRDGRLPFPLEEVVASMDAPVSPDEARAGLRVVQSLDPAGIGARNLEECLILQLDSHDPDYELQCALIRNHLRDIETNRFPKIVHDTGADMEAVKRAIAYVCSLHPAPGRIYDTEVIPYVVPDVIVELVDGEYLVSLDEGNIPHLRVSRTYRQMMSDAQKGSDTREFLRKKLESARWLIDSIEQRRHTLLKVAREIVVAQRGFLDKGVTALRPLKMQEVADLCSIHVATVSRAVRHKYMQTPRGIFPMKFFFTGGMSAGNGEVQSWDAVKQQIKDIIDGEDKDSPLSDDDITARLHRQGLEIARRTVTKYRKAMDIPSSRQRKHY